MLPGRGSIHHEHWEVSSMEQTILLKGTDLRVSPIAMGTVNAGLDWDGAEADQILNHYVDHGGNLIDTARVYNDWVGTEAGRSERVIGEWLRRCPRRQEIVLMTKGGHPNKDSMDVSRMGQADMEHDLNLSLSVLGVDCIDIYFYHRDDTERSVDELLERMEGFRRSGKIRYYGCSNWSAERMAQAEAYAACHGLRGFVANQNLYNMGAKYMKPYDDATMIAVDSHALSFFRQSNITLMPYFGICSGFFHKLIAGNDSVKESCYYTEGNLLLAKKILNLCQFYHCTISQALLGFFLVQDFTMIPLAGAASIAQLDDIMHSTDIPFQKKDFIL